MINYTPQYLHNLVTHGKSRDYSPFPGKVPIRIFIRVTADNPTHTYTRFFYNGKWCWSAVRRAIKVYNSLQGPKSSFVCEYSQTSILYHGSLDEGVVAPERSKVFVGNGGFVFMKHQHLNYRVLVPAIPVRCNSRTTLMWTGEKKPVAEIRREFGRLFRGRR